MLIRVSRGIEDLEGGVVNVIYIINKKLLPTLISCMLVCVLVLSLSLCACAQYTCMHVHKESRAFMFDVSLLK